METEQQQMHLYISPCPHEALQSICKMVWLGSLPEKMKLRLKTKQNEKSLILSYWYHPSGLFFP